MRSKSRSKSLRKINLYLSILRSIKHSNSLPSNLYKQKRQWYIDQLQDMGFITKVCYGTWNITEKGSNFLKVKVKSQRVKSSINLDLVLRIKIPIVKKLENPYPADLEKTVKGWIKKYHWMNLPFYDLDLMFELTTRNLIIYIHHMRISKPEDIEIVTNYVKRWCKEYFSTKRILLLDDLNATVCYIKYGVGDPRLKQLIPKDKYPVYKLGRNRRKILFGDPDQEATVYFDNTPFDHTLHSNDQDYVNNYVKMPEKIDKIIDALHIQNQSMKTFAVGMDQHMALINKIDQRVETDRELINELRDLTKALTEVSKSQNEDLQYTKGLTEGLRQTIRSMDAWEKWKKEIQKRT